MPSEKGKYKRKLQKIMKKEIGKEMQFLKNKIVELQAIMKESAEINGELQDIIGEKENTIMDLRGKVKFYEDAFRVYGLLEKKSESVNRIKKRLIRLK